VTASTPTAVAPSQVKSASTALVTTDETPNATPDAPASSTLRISGDADCQATTTRAATAAAVARAR
jgi:hypothetical protein